MSAVRRGLATWFIVICGALPAIAFFAVRPAQAALSRTTTTLVSSLNPSGLGQAVTFTATVTGLSPTGTVTFKDGATTLGTATLNGAGRRPSPLRR
jgi:hypothetical protein